MQGVRLLWQEGSGSLLVSSGLQGMNNKMVVHICLCVLFLIARGKLYSPHVQLPYSMSILRFLSM